MPRHTPPRYWRVSTTNTATTTIGCASTALNSPRCAESKSLKLYLHSFRNHGSFHEDCVNTIMKDLIHLMSPKYIEVVGIFVPRGGISIYPYANYGQPGTKYEEMAQFRFMRHDL